MKRQGVAPEQPSLERVRKVSKVLVIDDVEPPYLDQFRRDGYHVERWAEIENLSYLTDGYFTLIMLDIHGVGLSDSPQLQGVGILRHIKRTNPAQPVIVYSAKDQTLANFDILSLADKVINKGLSYVDLKELVDTILLQRSTPGYFIQAMNRELGAKAALAPKAVPKALRAMSTGRSNRFYNYINRAIGDPDTVKIVMTIVTSGISVAKMVSQ